MHVKFFKIGLLEKVLWCMNNSKNSTAKIEFFFFLQEEKYNDDRYQQHLWLDC